MCHRENLVIICYNCILKNIGQMDTSQENVQPNTNNHEQQEVQVQKLSIYSFYQLFLIKRGANCFMAKVFLQRFDKNYQKEKNTLAILNHPNIIQIASQSTYEYLRTSEIITNSLLLFPFAQHGDFLKYIQKYGAFPQKITSFYTRKLISALSYAKQKNIQHPHLVAQNLLMNKQRDLLLCGWSNSLNKNQQNLQNIFFALGQIIILLCTSKSPFISKTLSNDPYGKLLKQPTLLKFWQQFQKNLSKINKQLKLSIELKALISDLFLKKVKSYQDLLKYQWFINNQIVTKEDVINVLEEIQLKYLEKKLEKQAKIRNHQKQEKQCIKNINNGTFNNLSSRGASHFVQQYQKIQKQTILLPQKDQSDQTDYTPLFDSNPKLIISHLRSKLKSLQGQQQTIIDPLLLITSSQIQIQNNTIKINISFGWNYNMLQDKSSIYPAIVYCSQLVVKSDKGRLVGCIKMGEDNQINQLNHICITRLNQWIMNQIREYPQNI